MNVCGHIVFILVTAVSISLQSYSGILAPGSEYRAALSMYHEKESEEKEKEGRHYSECCWDKV